MVPIIAGNDAKEFGKKNTGRSVYTRHKRYDPDDNSKNTEKMLEVLKVDFVTCSGNDLRHTLV